MSTALLVMDVQVGIVSRVASDDGYLPRLREVIDSARAAGVPVVYVVVGFRAGYPEVSARNKSFAAIAAATPSRFTSDDPDARIHPAIGPLDADVVVTKKRVSAFAGSDLELVLRSLQADHLALTGIATSGVVLSTLRQAADLDFGLTVIADCCLDGDDDVHRVLTEKVFPRQADVVPAAEWTQSLG